MKTKTVSDRLRRWQDALEACDPVEVRGRVTRVVGLLVESSGPAAAVGEICALAAGDALMGYAEVVGFRAETTLLMPLGGMEGIRPGLEVVATGSPLMAPQGKELLGRVLDGLGRPIDDLGPLPKGRRPVLAEPPHPLRRRRISQTMGTGVRVIDGFLSIGRGQRMGIFAGSGVGKSVLMGMLARRCESDVNVICLIGERGREVREFLERDLGPEGMARSVVVCATSDQPAVVRVKSAFMATAIAESFRDEGKDVLLMMDSSTRLAMAQREIGLAVGEPPATKGYTPSVFALLPQVFERAGTAERGSITGLYTVLADGDDMEEPVADAIRSILDGHVVLSRDLANRNHYPAVDVLKSISRCMSDIADNEHKAAAREILGLMAVYRENEDLINLGAYAKGSNAQIDLAVRMRDRWQAFVRQDRDESASSADSRMEILRMAQAARTPHSSRPAPRKPE
ncbi:MAG: FliI/YscN family ATPase [Fibrobacteria bacterium]|nr:FliI/YscN family ATPase [Fibrobacteria bacterium]